MKTAKESHTYFIERQVYAFIAIAHFLMYFFRRKNTIDWCQLLNFFVCIFEVICKLKFTLLIIKRQRNDKCLL